MNMVSVYLDPERKKTHYWKYGDTEYLYRSQKIFAASIEATEARTEVESRWTKDRLVARIWRDVACYAPEI